MNAQHNHSDKVMHAFVILNPVAGQGDPEETKRLFSETQSAGRWTYDLYETTGEEDLKQVVQDALVKDYDLVVACGGDGTVSGVADGVAGTKIPFGILPGGTANAFAGEMDIPNDMADALEVILSGTATKTMDAVECEGRYYLLEVSLGILSSSFEDVSRDQKDRLGWLAYLVAIIKKWIGLEPVWVELEVDGQTHRVLAAEVAVFNTSHIGIIDQELDADIKGDDGILDLYAIRSKTLVDILRILFYRIAGKPRKAPHIHYWQVRESVRISTENAISYQADGDMKGKTPVRINVAKGVLRVITPRA